MRRYLFGVILTLLISGSGASAGPVTVDLPDGSSLTPESVGFVASPDGSSGYSFAVLPSMQYFADINDRGQIVGDTLYSDGTFTTIEYPGAGGTFLEGINDAGTIVGELAGPSIQAFTYQAGTFSTFQVPGSTENAAYGVNNHGHIVGAFVMPDAQFRFSTQAFLNTDGVFTTFRLPGMQVTYFTDINDHQQIVGNFVDSAGLDHPFLYQNGALTPIVVPYGIGAGVWGINNAGQIVGNYVDTDGPLGLATHGFLYDGGDVTKIEFPGVPGQKMLDVNTTVRAINNHGQILGVASYNRVPEPATMSTFGVGLASLALIAKRRRRHGPQSDIELSKTA